MKSHWLAKSKGAENKILKAYTALMVNDSSFIWIKTEKRELKNTETRIIKKMKNKKINKLQKMK